MEIILATNANVEGDALALYLENIIKLLARELLVLAEDSLPARSWNTLISTRL